MLNIEKNKLKEPAMNRIFPTNWKNFTFLIAQNINPTKQNPAAKQSILKHSGDNAAFKIVGATTPQNPAIQQKIIFTFLNLKLNTE